MQPSTAMAVPMHRYAFSWRRGWSSLRTPKLAIAAALASAGLLLFVGATLAAPVVDGDNIAPLSPYTISPLPNYPLAKGVPLQVLTDGRRASGRFWVSTDSIGWSWQSPIVYRQRFAMLQAIRRVSIGTGQNLRASIELPSNAFVYASGQDERWVYLGDAGQTATRDDGVQTLSLDFPPIKARELAIVIFRGSPYMFLDEVQILAASAGGTISPGNAVRDAVADAVARRRAFAERRAGVAPLGDEPAGRFAWPLGPENPSVPACQVTRIAPWTESDPEAIRHATAFDGNSINAVGGWLSGAVRIDNLSREPLKAELTLAVAAGASPAKMFIAHYVLALDYRWRADVLVPSAATVVLPARSMSLVVVRARVMAPGEVSAGIQVNCGESHVDVVLAGRALSARAEDRPHGDTWSYLLGPLRHVKRCDSAILDDSWIDTAVVDSSALTPDGGPEAETRLRAYLRSFPTSRRLLLFLDLTQPAWTNDSGPELDAQLRTLWAWVSRVIREEAYAGEILFYPIDEPKPDQIERLNAAARILRRIAPSIRIFSTIDNLAAAFGADAEVKQIQDRILSVVTALALLGHSPEVYATENSTKSLSLSGYYRRLAWVAFAAGLHGVGIWSMWDGNGADRPDLGWSDFGGIERDFNLSYADRSGCPLASRRLMALQRGLEDFAIMSACQRDTAAVFIRAEALPAAKSEGGGAPSSDFDPILARIGARCS